MFGLFNSPKKSSSPDHSIPLSGQVHPEPYAGHLIRSFSLDTGVNLLQSGYISLNVSSKMSTFLDFPAHNTLEETAVHAFIHHLQHIQNGGFRRSLAFLLGAKHAVPPQLTEQFLADPASFTDEKFFSKLIAPKDIGFLFVEILHHQSPVTFENNKTTVCFVSLSQEFVVDKTKFCNKKTALLAERDQTLLDLQHTEKNLSREINLSPNERSSERLAELKQNKKKLAATRHSLEVKLRKLEEAHRRSSQMRPYIDDINQLIQTVATILNTEEGCPVYFVPTLKPDNRFTQHFLSRVDSMRSASFKTSPPAAKKMMEMYLDMKTMEDSDKNATLSQFESFMTAKTPVLFKPCSEKLLTNTMLKLIRLAAQKNMNQSVILNFKYEMHYPISCKTLTLTEPPSPHDNCRQCQFTYFLVHSSLSNTDTAATSLGIENILECLSEDDDPVHEIRSLILDPYNRACEKQRALLINITDILNQDDIEPDCREALSLLYDRVTGLSKKNIRLFETQTDQLCKRVALFGPDTTLPDIHQALAYCDELVTPLTVSDIAADDIKIDNYSPDCSPSGGFCP